MEHISKEILSYPVLFEKLRVNPNLKISVVLPVRNEEKHIVEALDALRLQQDRSGVMLLKDNYEILMLANNCTDQSVSIARAYQLQHPGLNLHIEEITLPAPVAHIGTVRRMLMDAAYERFSSINHLNGVIASTDSDSVVDKYWVYQTLMEIDKGNDVVGGRIFTKSDNNTYRLYYLRDIAYKQLVSKLEDRIDPIENDQWPRHFQCFGASFAVTCRIYDLCGRLPVVPFLEDMALHKSLVKVDARIRLSPLVQVYTSSRIHGRVDFGLSVQLKQWGEMNQNNAPMVVEPVGSLVTKFKARKLLRETWKNKALDSSHAHSIRNAARLLNLNIRWLKNQFLRAKYFGEFWETVLLKLEQNGWSQTWNAIDVTIAISELRTELA